MNLYNPHAIRFLIQDKNTFWWDDYKPHSNLSENLSIGRVNYNRIDSVKNMNITSTRLNITMMKKILKKQWKYYYI